MPKVSVIIPTHQRPMLLIRAIKSVRAQTYKDYEIIIVSNGEHGSDRDVNRSTAAFYGARFIELEKGNLSIARNSGIEAANGDWVAFLDDDDEWFSQKLEKQMKIADTGRYDLICCDFISIHLDGHTSKGINRPPDNWSYLKAISHDIWWPIPSGIIVKTTIAKSILFDPSIKPGEDIDFVRRACWDCWVFQVPEILVRYHVGHSSVMRDIQNKLPHFMALIKYHRKMVSDTPTHLRHTIPTIAEFFVPRLKWLWPYFIRQPRKAFVGMFRRNSHG